MGNTKIFKTLSKRHRNSKEDIELLELKYLFKELIIKKILQLCAFPNRGATRIKLWVFFVILFTNICLPLFPKLSADFLYLLT